MCGDCESAQRFERRKDLEEKFFSPNSLLVELGKTVFRSQKGFTHKPDVTSCVIQSKSWCCQLKEGSGTNSGETEFT